MRKGKFLLGNLVVIVCFILMFVLVSKGLCIKRDSSVIFRNVRIGAFSLNKDSMLSRMNRFNNLSDSEVYEVSLHFLWNGKIDVTKVKIPVEELNNEEDLNSQIVEYIANVIYARGVTKGIEKVAITYDLKGNIEGEKKRNLANEIKNFIKNDFFDVTGQAALTEFAYYVNFGRNVGFYDDENQISGGQSIDISYSDSFNVRQGAVIGIDIGGTNIETICVISDLRRGEKISESVNKQGADELLEQIKNHINSVINRVKGYKNMDSKIDAIGIIFPGPVYEGNVQRLTNFGDSWNESETKKLNAGLEEIAKEFDIEVIVENDANAGGFGVVVGDNKDLGVNQIVFGLGTGVGFTQVIDGQVISHPYEGGHIPVVLSEGEWKCGCGAGGCLETYAAKKGIVKSAVIKLSKKKGLNFNTAEELVKKAIDGDSEALSVIGAWKGESSFTLKALESGFNNTVGGENFADLDEQSKIDKILGDYITPEDIGNIAAEQDNSLQDLAKEVWQDIARYIAEAVVVAYKDLDAPDKIILTGGIVRGETARMLKDNVEKDLSELAVIFPEVKDIEVELGDTKNWGAYGAAQYANMVWQRKKDIDFIKSVISKIAQQLDSEEKKVSIFKTYLLIEKGELDEALQIAHEIKANKNLVADIYIDIARAYRAKGDLNGANKAFSKAIEMAPGILTYAEMGKDEFEDMLEKAKEIKFSDLERIKTLVAIIRSAEMYHFDLPGDISASSIFREDYHRLNEEYTDDDGDDYFRCVALAYILTLNYGPSQLKEQMHMWQRDIMDSYLKEKAIGIEEVAEEINKLSRRHGLESSVDAWRSLEKGYSVAMSLIAKAYADFGDLDNARKVITKISRYVEKDGSYPSLDVMVKIIPTIFKCFPPSQFDYLNDILNIDGQ